MSDEITTDDAPGEDGPTPQEWAQLWSMELEAARKELKKWQKRAKEIDKRFRDDRGEKANSGVRWNVFTSSTIVQRSLMYGKTPQVNVTRRFADAKDSVARVSAELLERLLNTDIERDGDGYALALQNALDDFLLGGLGNVRVRYESEFEETEEQPAKTDPKTGKELAPAVPPVERKAREEAEVDYVHWQDQLWSPSRVWQEVRWWAFRNEMSREALVKRFGKLGRLVPLNAKKSNGNASDRGDKPAKPSPWGRAEVWEIWDKERKKVFWYVEGFDRVLDVQDDPFGLEGFWPFPRPMMANVTTSGFVPTPDFVLAQDIYNEIDLVSTKISELQEALRVAGVYDGTSQGVEQLLEAGGRNRLIPVKNWGAFAEKGGLRGAIEWLPIEQIANVMDKLRDYRTELMTALYQVAGLSDIMRGQASDTEATATEQSIKAKFGSVRIQAKQDEFARFASEVQWLKAQVIARFFEPETILDRANAQYMFDDPSVAQQAVQLIKERVYEYRVQVKPENVSLTDFSALKQESMEVLDAIGAFVQRAAPLAQQMPGSLPYLLQMLQWAVARLRGASTIEGVLDRAIQSAEQQLQQMAQQPQQQQQDPRVQAAQLKMQADQARAENDARKQQAELQADVVRAQLEVQTEAQKQEIQTQQNIKEERAREAIKAAYRPPSAPPTLPGGAQ